MALNYQEFQVKWAINDRPIEEINTPRGLKFPSCYEVKCVIRVRDKGFTVWYSVQLQTHFQ